LSPVAVGVVAYGCFVRGELDAAMEVGARAVSEAVRLGSLTAGLAERALANVCFYRQNAGEAGAWGAKMEEAALATGAPGLVAHAYYMPAVEATSVDQIFTAVQGFIESRDAMDIAITIKLGRMLSVNDVVRNTRRELVPNRDPLSHHSSRAPRYVSHTGRILLTSGR